MSRNFEILQRARVLDTAVPPTSNSSAISGSSDGQHHPDCRKPIDAEAVKLVQRLFVFRNSNAPKVVVFAGVQEGSAEICSNAAEALAAQGMGSVCMVDGNLSAPAPNLLNVEKLPGATDALGKAWAKDSVVRAGGGHFWVLPDFSGGSGRQQLGVDRMRIRMQELRKEFDYILIDAPPIGETSDAILLGQLADGIVLIIEAHSTRRENARTAKEKIESAHVKVLGAVLNNRTFPIPEAIYRKL